ncbi:MAG: hypothetical protein ABII26_06095, partial [Pseudomonadota bacterium]
LRFDHGLAFEHDFDLRDTSKRFHSSLVSCHSSLWLRSWACIRNTESTAGHATNIAEEVIYMIEGEIIRHGRLKQNKEE